MESRPIAVVTSKQAQKDLDTIKARHLELVTGLQNHALKVQQFRQQKDQETQQNQQRSDQKQEADRQFMQKQGEINMKSYGSPN